MTSNSLIVLLLIILSSLGVFFFPEQSISINNNHNSQQILLIRSKFQLFKQKFNRKYTLEQQKFRFKIFKDNLKMIKQNNEDISKTYKMGITKFSDMTEEQFRYQILTPGLLKMKKDSGIQQVQNLQAPPASVDWRGKNVITPVKDQGSCGSCWSFSTTGSLQAAVAMRDKKLLSFSQQQLIDCCKYAKYGCQGCSGAWPQWALNYVKDTGIVLQSEYSYQGVQQTCKPTPTAQKLLNIRKPFTILSNNTDVIKSTLATQGPLSICIDAYKWSQYVSGVFNDCHDSQTNHAVLLVGYQDDGVWIIKNSWGTTWGEQGYIRISGKGSACLVKSHVIVPHLA